MCRLGDSIACSKVVVSDMRRRYGLVVLVAVVSGVVLALVSGFYQQNLSDRLGVSVMGYGLPLSWYTTSWVVYPTSPVLSSYSWDSFALDVAFWSFIVFTIIMIALTLVT